MKAKIFGSFVALFLVFAAAEAQPGWKWPDDENMANKAKEINARYTDLMKEGKNRQAANMLSWLLANTPDLNKAIYINGNKIYDDLATSEKDAMKRAVYQDSALIMYDLRIQYFNEKAGVLNRKAFSAYKFYKDDSSKYKELLELFKESMELNKVNTWDNNLLAYFDIVRRYQKDSKAFSNDEILEIFGQIEELIDTKMSSQKADPEKLAIIKDQIENMLIEIIDVDCEVITNTLGPKFKANPEIKMAKTILRLSIVGKCFSVSPVAVEAAKFIFDSGEKEYGIAILIASNCYSNEDWSCAEDYYQQAAELAKDNASKAEAYISLANLQLKKGSKSAARDYAKKAIAADATNKTAPAFIASLYMNSFNDCKQDKDPVQDRAVFLAAYNWYQKAGDREGMAKAKEQFPSMEEIFTWNYEVGAEIRVNCWINETATIQKRD